MTIRCPRCGTLYRRPADRRRDASAFRCARCRHVFEDEAAEPAMVSQPIGEEDEDVERFAFDDDAEDEPTPADGAPEPAAAEEPEAAAVTTPARFALRALFTVTLAYAVLSIYLYTHPEAAARGLGRIPLLGPMLAETRLNPASIQLTNLSGEYRRVKGDRLVFAIGGVAVNDSSLPARAIQIEGWIEGAEEQRQVVFCGAAPRDIGNLSLGEIALLQSLEPPRDWTLGPGQQAPFLVVFTAPPEALREFGAQVVAVQAPRRAARTAPSGARPTG